MRVLLDECVPRKLRSELPGHDVKTVADMKWTGTKNGELLQRAAGEFHTLVTVDQGMPYQQNLSGMAIALVIVEAHSNDIKDLRPAVPELLRVLSKIQAGQAVRVTAQSTAVRRP
jgi:hypothetical protein